MKTRNWKSCGIGPVVVLACLLSLTAIGERAAYGALLVYEGFDYDPNTLNGLNGGTGWGGGWNSTFDVVAGSLTPPDGYALTPTGGRATGNESTHAAPVLHMRDLAAPISLNPISPETYYFSILVQRFDLVNGGGSEWGNWIELRRDSANPTPHQIVTFGSGSGEDLVTRIFGGSGGVITSQISPSHQYCLKQGEDPFEPCTFLIVGKVIANPAGTEDQLFMKLYQSGRDVVKDEPRMTQWDNHARSDRSQNLDNWTIVFGGAIGTVAVDELRAGTTWADVVGPTAGDPPRQPPFDSLPTTKGLIGHFDSQHVNVVDDAGTTRVSEWIDQSGNGTGASNATAANMPEYVPAALNGLPVLRFDGVDDYLDIPANSIFVDRADGSNDPNAEPKTDAFDCITLGCTLEDIMTWFVVAKPATATGNDGEVILATANTHPFPFANKDRWWGTGVDTEDTGDQNSPDCYRAWTMTGGGARVFPYDPPPAVPVFPCFQDQVVTGDWVIIGGAWQHINYIQQSVNGIRRMHPDGSVATSSPEDHVRTRIGAHSGGSQPSSGFFGGDVAEILIYNSHLSGSARDAIIAYLGNKYGIATTIQERRLRDCGEVWENQIGNDADFTQDCLVDLADFSELHNRYLTSVLE